MNILQEARAFRAAQEAAVMYAPDQVALRQPSLYPQWSGAGVAYYGADQQEQPVSKVRYGGQLWKCRQGHKSQEDWAPGTATGSLWQVIDETHAGTAKDPIPAAAGMEYTEGLYYSEGQTIYRCTRSTGQAVYNLPSELVGIYFEAYTPDVK